MDMDPAIGHGQAADDCRDPRETILLLSLVFIAYYRGDYVYPLMINI
jgi:hypothetical protein